MTYKSNYSIALKSILFTRGELILKMLDMQGANPCQ
nr:MAG TPA: hypothetical protein [Caudoviricetes sp.]